MGFPLPAVTYLAENLSGLKNFCIIPFCFLLIFDRELSFSFVLFQSLIGNFFFLLFLKHVSSSTVSDSSFLGDYTVSFSEGKDGNSHPASRFMVI